MNLFLLYDMIIKKNQENKLYEIIINTYIFITNINTQEIINMI